MIVDPRPFYVIKMMRVRDLTDDDVVLDWHPDLGNYWTRATPSVRKGLCGPPAEHDLRLVQVQVRENPRAVPDPPPVPVELDTRYRDAMRGKP